MGSGLRLQFQHNIHLNKWARSGQSGNCLKGRLSHYRDNSGHLMLNLLMCTTPTNTWPDHFKLLPLDLGYELAYDIAT